MKEANEMFDAFIQRNNLQKVSQQAKKTTPPHNTPKPKATMPASIPVNSQVPASNNTASTQKSVMAFDVRQHSDLGFTDETYRVLNQYNEVQCNKIIGFFFEMLRNFSSQFTHLYGSEPDSEFAMFAVDLDPDDAQRVVEHLKERLLSGKEWPPAPGMLRMLKDLPLNSEVFEARHNILVLKQPKSRVERYIMARKSTRLRALSERNLADEFRLLYVEAFDEVRRGVDKELDAKQQQYSQTIAHTPPTERDKQITAMVKEGVQLEGKLAERLQRIQKLRQQQPKSTIEQEQAELARKIRSQC